MKTHEFIKSKPFKISALAIGILMLMLLSFAAGIRLGLRKARFSYAFGEHYERNFAGPRHGGPMGFFGEPEGRDFRNPHGLAGSIISISDNNILIRDRDNKEYTVSVNERTMIKSRQTDLKISDLKTDEQIVVVGKPGDNGVINADLIRVFDGPPSPTGSSLDSPAPNQDSGLNPETNPNQ